MEKGNIELTDVELKDIINLNFLQKFQDDFSKSMNIASITVDRNGIPFTKPSVILIFVLNLLNLQSLGKSVVLNVMLQPERKPLKLENHTFINVILDLLILQLL